MSTGALQPIVSVMKSPLLSFLSLSFLAFTLAAPVQAEDNDKEPSPTEKTVKKSTEKLRGAVLNALNELDLVNAELNTKARFFIYLQSASWCGPCCAEMPKIVKAYPEMKKKGVEIILLGHDSTNEGVEKYLKKFEAPFPGVQYKNRGVQDLPGFRSCNGIPWATLVDANGNVIAHSHASGIFATWKEKTDHKVVKELIKEQKKAEKAEGKAAKEKGKKKK